MNAILYKKFYNQHFDILQPIFGDVMGLGDNDTLNYEDTRNYSDFIPCTNTEKISNYERIYEFTIDDQVFLGNKEYVLDKVSEKKLSLLKNPFTYLELLLSIKEYDKAIEVIELCILDNDEYDTLKFWAYEQIIEIRKKLSETSEKKLGLR